MTAAARPERVLVTGASSGIGLEIARILAAEGSNLLLVARRGDRLREIARQLAAAHDTDVRAVPIDLAQRGAVAAVVEALERDGIEIDVLVNNAGFGQRGAFLASALDRQIEMIRLNVEALVEMTGRLAPGMVHRGHGGILNVASVAAFQPGPRMAIYFATKAMVLSFSEALHEEFKGSGVAVSCLCPGPTESEFRDVAGARDSRLFQRMMSAEAVARAGVRGLRANRAVVVPGFGNRIIPLAERLLPRSLVRRIAGAMQ